MFKKLGFILIVLVLFALTPQHSYAETLTRKTVDPTAEECAMAGGCNIPVPSFKLRATTNGKGYTVRLTMKDKRQTPKYGYNVYYRVNGCKQHIERLMYVDSRKPLPIQKGKCTPRKGKRISVTVLEANA